MDMQIAATKIVKFPNFYAINSFTGCVPYFMVTQSAKISPELLDSLASERLTMKG
jgi:hypothetical protein